MGITSDGTFVGVYVYVRLAHVTTLQEKKLNTPFNFVGSHAKSDELDAPRKIWFQLFDLRA